MLGYDGKRVVVVGGASGMGEAASATAAALGAHVTILDVQHPATHERAFIEMDLRDRASTEASADALVGPIDVLLSCAGVADGSDGIERVNLIGQLHLIERLLADGKIARGSAIAMISSTAGLGWNQRLDLINEVLDLASWDERQAWMDDHNDLKTYSFTKEAVIAFVARSARDFMGRGIRINALLPGPTDTPLARANHHPWLTWGQSYREGAGIEALTPQQQADALIFMCSNLASGMSGTTLVIDQGLYASMGTGTYVEPLLAQMMQE